MRLRKAGLGHHECLCVHNASILSHSLKNLVPHKHTARAHMVPEGGDQKRQLPQNTGGEEGTREGAGKNGHLARLPQIPRSLVPFRGANRVPH